MRYIRVYLPLSLVGEDEASPGNAVIARCVDGVVALAIVDALNAA